MQSLSLAQPEPHLLQRAARSVGGMLRGLAMILFIPLAILAAGIPLALGVRLVLWLTGQL